MSVVFLDLWNRDLCRSCMEINSKSDAIHLAVLFGEVKIRNPLLVETCKASFAMSFKPALHITAYD